MAQLLRHPKPSPRLRSRVRARSWHAPKRDAAGPRPGLAEDRPQPQRHVAEQGISLPQHTQ